MSPAGLKYKTRCSSRINKGKPPIEDTSKVLGYPNTLGAKKQSVNQSLSKCKMTPQTTRYSMAGMEKYFKFKQSQVSTAELTEQQKQIKKVKSLKNLKS